jgi:hypothetical protein
VVIVEVLKKNEESNNLSWFNEGHAWHLAAILAALTQPQDRIIRSGVANFIHQSARTNPASIPHPCFLPV